MIITRLTGGPVCSPASPMACPVLRSAISGLRGTTAHRARRGGAPPQEIRVAVEVLLAQRIGHGTTLLDDPAVVDLVVERGVTIEACPTSNVHTGVIEAVSAHPLGAWLRRGLRVCVCTDNTLLSAVTLPEEMARVAAVDGVTADDLRRVTRFGHEAAFGG